MSDDVLVIVGPGLGRLVHATGGLAALRRRHAGARITALTTADAAGLAVASPFVDAVIVDRAVPWWRLSEARSFQRELRERTYVDIYDLGDPERSRAVFRAMYGWRGGRDRAATLAWHGPGAMAANAVAASPAMHAADRITHQLGDLGIVDVPRPDLGWVARTVRSYTAPFKMNEPYALLCADAGPSGAWPRDGIVAMSEWFAARGLTPVLVAMEPHPALADQVVVAVPRLRDITGQAPAGDLVFMAWGAHAAVGADSGLMTLLATAGCKSVVLCGAGSDPAIDGPRGTNVAILQREVIAGIKTAEITRLLDGFASLGRVS
jgi:ADP-heptose:LPS heptosyltransferase